MPIEYLIAEQAIARGLAFMEKEQLPSGELPAFYGTDKDRQVLTPDSTVFPSVIAAMALQQLTRYQVQVEPILQRIETFLHAEAYQPGLWNYWTRQNPSRKIMPPDADDTVCVAQFLASRGVEVPEPLDVLLYNRAAESGLFYTWLIARPTQLKSVKGRKVFFKLLKIPFRFYPFYRKTPAHPDDVDTVVQLNILYFASDRIDRGPIIKHVNHIILEDKEKGCDKWYHSPAYLYYIIMKNRRKGIRFDPKVYDLIKARIEARIDPRTGKIGLDVLDTALYLTTLRMLGCEMPDQSMHYVLSQQDEMGAWPLYYFYYGGPLCSGPDLYFGWCSKGLSTALCLESIYAYMS